MALIKELDGKEKGKIVVIILLTAIALFLVGWYSYPLFTLWKFNDFRELYHNDYITTIKLFIEDCSELGSRTPMINHSSSNNNRAIVRHFVDLQGKHLGIIYRCSSQIPNNLTLSVIYSNQFYEVK